MTRRHWRVQSQNDLESLFSAYAAPASTGSGAASQATFKEHDLVRVLKPVIVEGVSLKRGAVGTIVAVYRDGEAFAVEFPEIPDGTEVLTMSPSQIGPAK